MFTVWLPTAYSANMSAQTNSQWTAISALHPEYGRWPTVLMCSADSHLCITESVDSVCRDTTYTQYMPIQKNLSKSQKRYTYKPL